MNPYFKSQAGQEKILNLYDQKLQDLKIDYDSITLNSSFGETHILTTGNINNPPLIIVHGSNGCAPIALETYPNLHLNFRVYAVDVLSQPNKSAGTRLSMKDKSYGQWMHEVIDLLQLEKVCLLGFSFGGLVILKSLEYSEAKIDQVFLAAPAYIVNGNPLRNLWTIFRPMKKYMKSKDIKYLKQFLSDVFSEPNEFALKFLAQVFLHFKMDFTPVPKISKSAAQAITTPITLFAAENDLMFPGPKMIQRANYIFPSLKEAYLLENSKHVQNRNGNSKIESLVRDSYQPLNRA